MTGWGNRTIYNGEGHQPIETNAPRVPPSSSVTECVPDNIVIGQRPTKPCDHDWNFLRQDSNCLGVQDVLYCRRCLEYREVKR